MRINTHIDRLSYIPLYAQVREALREAIEHGGAPPSTQLPSEIELCALFDVSRTVVRQALIGLQHEGLLVRRKGRGTFVARPKIGESFFQEPTGFYAEMVGKGQQVVSQVLQQHVIPCTPKLAFDLQIASGAPVIHIDRVRFVNDEPLVYVTTYLPHSLCPGAANVDLTHQSLYAYLAQTYGLVIARGRRTIKAVLAGAYEARLLAIVVGAPLIALDSVSYLEDGTPLESYHALHRGDRSVFEVDLMRPRMEAPQPAPLGTQAGASI